MERTKLDLCVTHITGAALIRIKSRLPAGRWVYRGSEKYVDTTIHFFSAPTTNKDGKRRRVTIEDKQQHISLPYKDNEHEHSVNYG